MLKKMLHSCNLIIYLFLCEQAQKHPPHSHVQERTYNKHLYNLAQSHATPMGAATRSRC